jgi:hypothetical protein
MNTRFDSEEMGARFDRLLDAVLPQLQGRVKSFVVGDEMDVYFENHPAEVGPYARFFARAVAHIKSLVPGAQVSASITCNGIKDAALLKPILDQTQFYTVTYYPLTPDFLVRDPSTVDVDFPRILAAAGSKKVFLEQVGYPSGAANGSSEDKQAECFSRMFDRVMAAPNRYIGISFCFMSDFSDSVTQGLTSYYGAQSLNRFGSFLQTLGMFDQQGRPKKSWAVFKRKLAAMSASGPAR